MRNPRRPTTTNPLGPHASIRARLGYALQCQRIKRGWTQGDLAERADMSMKYLGEIERGNANFAIANVEVLGRLLNWDPFSDALMVGGPRVIESARLVLRAELKHITETVALVLHELEPLATEPEQSEGANGDVRE